MTLPEPLHGPAFGSYAPDDVSWLLTDLSDADLEAPTAQREEAVQSGVAHYAESLPVEYQPDTAYLDLFHAALAESAARTARDVGLVAGTVRAERGDEVVLVSLARAGTPVGILVRRWLAARGIDAPHHAVSIVRDRGIDLVALRWLARHHDPARVVFVDGWTGKGAIAAELTAAVRHANAVLGLRPGAGFDPDLAVLADPGRCVRTFGTREDWLVASACLNSTVSGLVSRTVLNADLIGPEQFHGAKFYRELAGDDVSATFLDAVTAAFPDVADAVDADLPAHLAADRTPTWEGWAAVERIAAEHGTSVNLVKPGVGETTRVLLRRVPWKVLVRAGGDEVGADDVGAVGGGLDHVHALADARGVPLVPVADLPYRCVGLVRPRAAPAGEG